MKASQRLTLIASLVAGLCTVGGPVAAATSETYAWKNAAWGGGGFVTGTLFHPKVQGLAYARTDVGGLYRRDPGSTKWTPLMDHIIRPDSQLTGVVSVAVDPRDPSKVYAAGGMYLPWWGHPAAIFRSSDRGRTWVRTDLPINLGGNSDGRGTGERLVVDPNNGSILFLGTNQDGLYKSIDGGATWAKVTSFGPSSVNFVLFDPAGKKGQPTKTLYAGVATTTEASLYRSTDAGATWTAVPGGPAGLMPLQGALDANRNLLLTYSNFFGPNGVSSGGVWKLAPPTLSWSDISPEPGTYFGYGGVSVSATDPNVIVATSLNRWWPGDEVYRSNNGGASWEPLRTKSTMNDSGYSWLTAYSGGDLQGHLGHWMTDIDIDPFDPGHVMYNTGYGLWESGTLAADTPQWNFAVNGLEETCITRIISPRRGASVLATQGDVGGVRYAKNFKSTQGYFAEPNVTNLDIDTAEHNSNLVVRTATSGFGAYISSDNGVTWSHMPSSPVTTNDGGSIAVSARGSSMVWVPGGQSAHYSTDGGASWTPSTGYPTVGSFFSGTFVRPVADRAVDGLYYAYDFNTGNLLESVDGGRSFSVSLGGLEVLPSWGSQNSLVSIPGGKARDLWLGTPNGLYHIDGAGAPAQKLPSVQLAAAVSFGAPAPGATYPALFVAGVVDGINGIWRSDDQGANWVRITDDAHEFGGVNTLAGDRQLYGRVYLGTGCRGVMVGTR
ncbi:sialidase family protein [Ideonella sp.]|uniref:sialidase family protein n=1 Tax=Ideonella sp. TaxID=1929293 RepID=UPI002B499A37|nr:sialidase family protein [Ideonella sp.]HJV71148.1 sialidase family protein [Ideonella sp.]